MNENQQRELARLLNCITETELCTLTDTKPGTVKAWRNRGKGPAFVRFGRAFLYPVKDLQTYIDLMRIGRESPSELTAADMLA